jgi:uncharacterized protein
MMLVPTRRQSSAIHGTGLFATERISAGTPTWRFTAGLDQALHPDAVRALDDIGRDWLTTYAYLDIRTGLYVLCADDARFMNHSDTPNVGGDYEKEPVFGMDVALRDIEVGEELTCDYRTFDRIDRQRLHFEPNGEV